MISFSVKVNTNPSIYPSVCNDSGIRTAVLCHLQSLRILERTSIPPDATGDTNMIESRKPSIGSGSSQEKRRYGAYMARYTNGATWIILVSLRRTHMTASTALLRSRLSIGESLRMRCDLGPNGLHGRSCSGRGRGVTAHLRGLLRRLFSCCHINTLF